MSKPGKYGNAINRGGKSRTGPSSMHLLSGPAPSGFLRRIAAHDSYRRHEARHIITPGQQTQCPLCGEVYRAPSKRDPLTGRCNNVNICSKRRSKLDDETIEFLGLIPRGKEND